MIAMNTVTVRVIEPIVIEPGLHEFVIDATGTLVGIRTNDGEVHRFVPAPPHP